MIRILIFILATALVVACSSTNEQTSPGGIIDAAAKARIDSTLKAMVDSSKVAGVSALVFENGKEVYFNSFGYADKEDSRSFDRNTLVRIYSMTKPITGVALMQLYEKGLFQLDDPLAKYMPEFADVKVVAGKDAKGNLQYEAPKRPITVRDLTRHTAGFAGRDNADVGAMVAEADVMNPENTLAQMASKLAKLPLAFHPGDQWAYGICVDVQAALVEVLSGKTFDVYVRENILDPLGMKETRYVPETMGRLAAVYRVDEEKKLQRVPDEQANGFNAKEWPLKPGGFGFTSSIDDYMKFAQMLVNEGTSGGVTILKPETVKLMATNHLSDSVTQRMWLPSKGEVGFGIDFAVRTRPPVDDKGNHGIVGEFFWDGAASTLFWVDPKNELTAVLFVQIFPFSRELHKVFRDGVYGKYEGVPTSQ